MNVWQFDDDDAPPAMTEPAKSGAKRVFFADDEPTATPAGRSATTSAASRRKQISASELIIDDDQDDGEGRGSSKAHTSVPSGRKLNETAAPDVVKRVGFSEGSSEPAVVIPARPAADADDMDAYAHHLVRTYLLHQGHDDVAALLDLEKVSSHSMRLLCIEYPLTHSQPAAVSAAGRGGTEGDASTDR